MKCLIDIDHDDYYEELHCKLIKGRKTWRCGECGCIIPKGIEHEVFVGKLYNDVLHDDEIHTHRTCLVCLSIRKKFCCNWTYEGMYDDIDSFIDSDYEMENCILMRANKKEYEKLCSKLPFLGEDREEDE